jgi:hypothetical protein
LALWPLTQNCADEDNKEEQGDDDDDDDEEAGRGRGRVFFLWFILYRCQYLECVASNGKNY